MILPLWWAIYLSCTMHYMMRSRKHNENDAEENIANTHMHTQQAAVFIILFFFSLGFHKSIMSYLVHVLFPPSKTKKRCNPLIKKTLLSLYILSSVHLMCNLDTNGDLQMKIKSMRICCSVQSPDITYRYYCARKK